MADDSPSAGAEDDRAGHKPLLESGDLDGVFLESGELFDEAGQDLMMVMTSALENARALLAAGVVPALAVVMAPNGLSSVLMGDHRRASGTVAWGDPDPGALAYEWVLAGVRASRDGFRAVALVRPLGDRLVITGEHRDRARTRIETRMSDEASEVAATTAMGETVIWGRRG